MSYGISFRKNLHRNWNISREIKTIKSKKNFDGRYIEEKHL
jgi:hypothetical protein